MKKAAAYREHARECRQLAATMDSDEQRAQLLQMAEHWEKLAADRAALVQRHPELADRTAPVEPRSFLSDGDG